MLHPGAIAGIVVLILGLIMVFGLNLRARKPDEDTDPEYDVGDRP